MNDLYNEEPIAEINIIPFVDIILVVLIVFMVTAPFALKEGFHIQLPQGASSAEAKPSPLSITVHHTGDIFFNGKLISTGDLSFLSRKMFEEKNWIRAVISADKSVSHGRVMEIVGVLKKSGIQHFVFSTH